MTEPPSHPEPDDDIDVAAWEAELCVDPDPPSLPALRELLGSLRHGLARVPLAPCTTCGALCRSADSTGAQWCLACAARSREAHDAAPDS